MGDNKNDYECIICGTTHKSYYYGLDHVYSHGVQCNICQHPITSSEHLTNEDHLIAEIRMLLESDIRLKYRFLNCKSFKNAMKMKKYIQLRNMLLHLKLKSK